MAETPETRGGHAAATDALLKRAAAPLELQKGEIDALPPYIADAMRSERRR